MTGSLTAQIVTQTADALVSSGLKAKGYTCGFALDLDNESPENRLPTEVLHATAGMLIWTTVGFQRIGTPMATFKLIHVHFPMDSPQLLNMSTTQA